MLLLCLLPFSVHLVRLLKRVADVVVTLSPHPPFRPSLYPPCKVFDSWTRRPNDTARVICAPPKSYGCCQPGFSLRATRYWATAKSSGCLCCSGCLRVGAGASINTASTGRDGRVTASVLACACMPGYCVLSALTNIFACCPSPLGSETGPTILSKLGVPARKRQKQKTHPAGPLRRKRTVDGHSMSPSAPVTILKFQCHSRSTPNLLKCSLQRLRTESAVRTMVANLGHPPLFSLLEANNHAFHCCSRG